MFGNTTVSSRSSSNRSGNSYGRNSSMPSLRMKHPLSSKTSFNPLFRHSDQLTSFDASNFVLQDDKCKRLEKKRSYLRRYNSHESSYSFDVISTNNDTAESAKSQNSRVGSVGETNSSSADRRNEKEYSARDFLERYSLPRVIKVEDGDPLLLYRCFDSFTKIQARRFSFKKGKERIDDSLLSFPEGYAGWFSLLNDKGEKNAVAHSSVLHLVREQVCSFLAAQPFTAYATQPSDATEDVDGKLAYFKTQVPGGQLFQLRAVFQHQERVEGRKNSTRSSRISRSSRDKDLANRYAQLISQSNQELYVPLTTKGEFYETHTSLKSRVCFPGMLDKTGPLALDKDCLYKISHLLRRVPLPVRVKLMHGSLPEGLPKDYYSDNNFLLEKKFREPILVTCSLPSAWSEAKHELSYINMNSKLKISKFTFGFDSENRLFKSQRIQTALAFCHKNIESWYKDVKLVPHVGPGEETRSIERMKNKQDKFKEEKLKFEMLEEENWKTKKIECLETSASAEKINVTENKQLITKEVLEKFPKPKKWYQHLKLLTLSSNEEKFEELKDPMDGMEKRRSIDRYKDMSKLIEEKLGRRGYNPVKKSASFMFSNKRTEGEEGQKNSVDSNNPALLKCQSLDSQLYPLVEENCENIKCGTTRSNKSDNLSYEFQMCILDNNLEDNSNKRRKQEIDIIRRNQTCDDFVKKGNSVVTKAEIIKEDDKASCGKLLKKTKPDLIPTLPKSESNITSSFITERLCAEFHVKTKVQNKKTMIINKNETNLSTTSIRQQQNQQISNTRRQLYVNNNNNRRTTDQKTEAEQRYKITRVLVNVEEVPYSHVADEVSGSPSGKAENIYAEICDEDGSEKCNKCDTCSSKNSCGCASVRTKSTQYCYVQLGSNGDSVTQSDSDEAIYNTLR